MRKLGNQFPTKLKYAKNLKQFFIGTFELTIDDTDRKWLTDEIEDRMLIRKEEATAQYFKAICKYMSERNVIFEEMMSRFGDSYLAAVYPMKVKDVDARGTTFVPKRVKNKNKTKFKKHTRFE